LSRNLPSHIVAAAATPTTSSRYSLRHHHIPPANIPRDSTIPDGSQSCHSGRTLNQRSAVAPARPKSHCPSRPKPRRKGIRARHQRGLIQPLPPLGGVRIKTVVAKDPRRHRGGNQNSTLQLVLVLINGELVKPVTGALYTRPSEPRLHRLEYSSNS